MKAETTETNPDGSTDLDVANEPEVSTLNLPVATDTAVSRDGADTPIPATSIVNPTSPVEITQDILSSTTTSPLTPQATRRIPLIIERLRKLIPDIGLDDRAGRATLSILLAVLLWVYVVNLENPAQTTVFNALSIDVRGLSQGLKLVNTIGQSSVTVQAPQSSLAELRPADVHPYIDLTGISAGVHTVPVRVDVSNGQAGGLSVSVNPGNVQVQLEIESSRDLPVQAQVTGTPAFGYGIDTAQVDPSVVHITGAQDLVVRVAKVVASVNVDEKAGTQRGARRPIALDESGAEITGLTFDPAQVQVVVPIKLLLNYKVVGVRADTRGQPAPGYRVSAITTDPNTVTICCSPTVLNDIQFLDTLPVSISGTTFNVLTQTQLLLPTDVELYPGQTKVISVTVDVEPLVTTLRVSVAPTIEGAPEGAGVVVSPDRLDLTLAGTFEQLQDLKPTDVKAFINVQGKGPGTYELSPQVIVPQGVKLETASPATVTVTLIAPTPVPTSTPLPEPTKTPQPTSTLTTLPTATNIPTPVIPQADPTPTIGASGTPLPFTPSPATPTPRSQPTPSP